MRRARRWPICLMLMACAGAAPAARAQTVYRCADRSGALAYQDRPCSADQRQSEVTLAAAPAYVPSPAYAGATAPTLARQRPPPRARPAREPQSWQCRAADGELFYRHGRCPAAIRTTPGSAPIAVTARPIARGEACRHIARGTHGGHARDESVSTYERNLGLDPCRRW